MGTVAIGCGGLGRFPVSDSRCRESHTFHILRIVVTDDVPGTSAKLCAYCVGSAIPR